MKTLNKIDRMQSRKYLLDGVDATITSHDIFKNNLRRALNEKLYEYNRLNSIDAQKEKTEAQFKEMLGFGKRMNVDSAQRLPSASDRAHREVSLLEEMDLGGKKNRPLLTKTKK